MAEVDNWIVALYLIVFGLVVYQVWIQGERVQDEHVRTRVITRVVPEADSSPIVDTRVPINVPTRGYNDEFHIIGYLQPLFERTDINSAVSKLHKPGCKHHQHLDQTSDEEPDRKPEHMLRLYGRQINSYQYEYYVTNHWDPEIKITLEVPRDAELTDGDTVRVPGYGPYRVVTYQPMYPRYL